MLPLLTSSEMAAADAYTIEEVGVPGLDLMEHAAESCVDLLVKKIAPKSRVAVVVGTGNNGGDGLAVARLLLDKGFRVTTWMAFPDRPFKGDANENHKRLLQVRGDIRSVDDGFLAKDDVDCIVDAIFGTGLDRAIEGPLVEIIRMINRYPAPVLSVDIPSGLSGSHGHILGEHVNADWTVTFQFLKIVHGVTPTNALCGEIYVADIGIQRKPGTVYSNHLLQAVDYQRAPRSTVSHKGSFGTLGIIGGFAGMEGASNLAALAALRFGVGKVRVFTNNRNRYHHDSVMVEHITHYRPGYDALVVGPGMGRGDDAKSQLRRLSLEKDRILWDADGLYFLAKHPGGAPGREWVMTPHPGEAAMLLDCLPREIQKDRLAALDGLHDRFPGGWILLKGNRTLICAPDGRRFVCETGSPALAVAGSGDVLSGMIGALMAQGRPMEEAVILGTLRHGIAGDRWSAKYTDYSMLAEDIIDDLRFDVSEEEA